ncbi:MAG: hypothetical protein BGO29_01335 [Bacteroidales bacterium 36-12]|nr:MAG: hypothetical protein BGO29_01335 [Bacteroidales bacterium 36-12]
MKDNFMKRRSSFIAGVILSLAIVVVLIGCVYLDSISIMQIQEDGTEAPIAKAGTDATFTVKGNINCQEDHGDVQFVVSFLAPKSWNVREHAKVTYVTTLHTDPDERLKMSIIPDSSLPKNAGGRTWGETLIQEYGVGPNVLSDMEWVSFITDDKWEIYNGDKPTYTIYITTNVGELNLRTYLGFFVNHTDDGISTSSDHKKVKFSDEIFEVVEGKGLLIDYAQEHFNKVQPLASLQDDYVTISFNGGVYANDLNDEDEVYFKAIAYDESGVVIAQIDEKTEKTLMKRESRYNRIRSLTIWPAQFFNVPEGATVNYIEYVFTNQDGTITITKSDDDLVTNNIPIDNPGAKVPFVFEFLCE